MTRDELAWLYATYRRPLIGYFRNNGCSPSDAEDLAADTVLSVYEWHCEKREGQPITPRLANCLVWRFADTRRVNRLRRLHARGENGATRPCDGLTELRSGDQPDRQARMRILIRRIAGHSPMYAAHVEAEMLGEGYSELAERLGVTTSGARTQRARLRRRYEAAYRDVLH